MIHTRAPAKINLYLHVTGRRGDGYHELDSLVGFAGAGDEVRLEEAEAFSFELEGPMAAGLEGQNADNNLVVRAARDLAKELGRRLSFSLRLKKNLPVASGIGGGSADAAAALRVMAIYWNVVADDPVLEKIAAGLGQDVPCCLTGGPCYFEGIGDKTSLAPALPYVDMVLVNPGIPLPTASVFKTRTGAFSAPAERLSVEPQTAQDLVKYLAPTRNDLTDPAIRLCPAIKEVLEALAATEGLLLARMAGSGATCFGIFADRSMARKAAAVLHAAHPAWWVAPTALTTAG